MIKLIAIDIDGTLLNSKREITQETKVAIQQALDKGIHVVICTGRPILGVKAILDSLKLSQQEGYVVTFNGGLILRSDTQDVVSSITHSMDDIHYMYQTLYAAGLPMNPIDTKNVYEVAYPKGTRSLYPDVMSKHLILAQKNIDEFDDNQQFNKAVCCTDAALLDTVFPTLPETFKQRFNYFKSRNILMEIMPKGVNKAKGLQILCDLLQITPQEVMAVGDEENDIDMIEFAGYGIAMGNAIDSVKQKAKYVTDTNDNDGLAKAIRQYAL